MTLVPSISPGVTRTAAAVAELELGLLRNAISTVPEAARGGLARLCIIVLLLDMADSDALETLTLLRHHYFQGSR